MTTEPRVGTDRLGAGAGGRRVNLVRLAAAQRVLIWFILIQLLAMGGYMVAVGTAGPAGIPGGMHPLLAPVIALIYVCVALASLVLVVRMARAYGYNWFMAIAGGILSLMSCIGLLFLVLLNQRVIKTLQAAGVKVGFMGVNAAEMMKLREGVCTSCGYDIRGLSGPVCPECGGVLARS